MACFLVPVTEAVVTTIVGKTMKANEEKQDTFNIKGAEAVERIPFSRKLKWLSNMLWGGSALLAFEHIWHGEVVPWFPFLTAAGSPADMVEMFQEMATAGIAMAGVVTLVWLGIVAVVSGTEKKVLRSWKSEK